MEIFNCSDDHKQIIINKIDSDDYEVKIDLNYRLVANDNRIWHSVFLNKDQIIDLIQNIKSNINSKYSNATLFKTVQFSFSFESNGEIIIKIYKRLFIFSIHTYKSVMPQCIKTSLLKLNV